MNKVNTHRGLKYKIKESMDYRPLIPIFIEAGLEATEFPEIEHALFNCYYLYLGEELIGGASVIRYDDDFIIQDFAIEKTYQYQGWGTIVYNYMLEDIVHHGGRAIYLTGKAPKFYERFGFVEISGDQMPGKIPGCFSCDRYQVDCFPIFMKLSL